MGSTSNVGLVGEFHSPLFLVIPIKDRLCESFLNGMPRSVKVADPRTFRELFPETELATPLGITFL